MEWSAQQESALKAFDTWFNRAQRTSPFFMLAGYAGTGKTTLAKHLASHVDGRVLFAAYTGKAASVLAKSGCPEPSTIHKLIYTPKSKSEARLVQLVEQHKNEKDASLRRALEIEIDNEKQNLKRPSFSLRLDSPLVGAKLLVLDEYSMIDDRVGRDLISFGIPILALGDPGQLPPVQGTPFFRRRPDIALTEIHRQAQGNPIIALAALARERGNVPIGDYGESRVVPYSDEIKSHLPGHIFSADQLLVGRNATRTASNRRVRDLMNYSQKSKLPLKGDKLVCLRNDYHSGVLNGQIFHVQDSILAVPDNDTSKCITLWLENEDDRSVIQCDAHAYTFLGEEPPTGYWSRREANEFDYGYALTVHKSQGSQWDDVILFDEWRSGDRAKWLYTAITRAARRITIVEMPA